MTAELQCRQLKLSLSQSVETSVCCASALPHRSSAQLRYISPSFIIPFSVLQTACRLMIKFLRKRKSFANSEKILIKIQNLTTLELSWGAMRRQAKPVVGLWWEAESKQQPAEPRVDPAHCAPALPQVMQPLKSFENYRSIPLARLHNPGTKYDKWERRLKRRLDHVESGAFSPAHKLSASDSRWSWRRFMRHIFLAGNRPLKRYLDLHVVCCHINVRKQEQV